MNDPCAIDALPAGDGETSTLDRSWLVKMLGDLGLSLDELDVCVAVIAAEHAAPTDFEIRVGEWRLDGSRGALAAIVNGVAITAALAALGAASIPAAVVSLVVPVIFNLERVEIRPSDRVVLVELLQDPWGRKPITDWYAGLPGNIQAEISGLEFRDLVDRLEDAGLATLDEFDTVTIDQPHPRRLAHLRLPPRT